jgi:hypothetical protein
MSTQQESSGDTPRKSRARPVRPLCELTDPETPITRAETAEVLGVATITIDQWRARSKGPAFLRFGRAIRYRLGDVIAYRDACRVGGTP